MAAFILGTSIFQRHTAISRTSVKCGAIGDDAGTGRLIDVYSVAVPISGYILNQPAAVLGNSFQFDFADCRRRLDRICFVTDGDVRVDIMPERSTATEV